MKEARIVYEVEFVVTVKDDELVLQRIVREGGEHVKTTTYIYTPEMVATISGLKKVFTPLKHKGNFFFLKEYIIDILNHPYVPKVSKYQLLDRYIHNAYLTSKDARPFLEKLARIVKSELSIKNEKEVSRDERETTSTNTT